MYITNLSFSYYENKYVAAHLYDLNLSYKTPFHSIFMDYLLDQYYEKVKNKVNAQLSAPWFLNFNTDELNNICKDCVISFLVHILKGYNTKRGYFYIYSEFNSIRNIDAKIQATWLLI